MPGSTIELNLATAVDSDDNADYLTLSLANSLRTVDALFNNVTGHNHGGAHQGGAIAPAAIPGGSITNAMLGADVARDNQIVNGGFEIWQRGAGPFTGNGVMTADRWLTQYGGGATLSVSQVGGVNALFGNYGASCAVNVGGGFANLQQKIENYSLNNTQLSFSIWAKTTGLNGAQAFIQLDGANTLGTLHTGNGQWQKLTVTTAGGITNADVRVGVLLTGNTTVYLDGAMLVVGSQAANYVPMHPADDLARCLRYYETIAEDFNVTGYGGAVSAPFQWYLNYKARKAVAATLTKVGPWTVPNCAQPTIVGVPSISGLNLGTVVTAVGNFQLIGGGAGFLVAESNP